VYFGVCRHHLEDLGIDGEDNIKIHLTEIGWNGTDWIDATQDRDKW
jgi:hypothetical protein